MLRAMGIALDERLLRVVAVIAGSAAFVTAAAVVRPDWSRADAPSAGMTAPATMPPDRAAPAPTATGDGLDRDRDRTSRDAGPDGTRPPVAELLPGASLGRLEGRSTRIEVRATPEGPRYLVVGPDGVVSDPAGLTARELAERHPELDLRDATAQGGTLMLADPDAAFPP